MLIIALAPVLLCRAGIAIAMASFCALTAGTPACVSSVLTSLQRKTGALLSYPYRFQTYFDCTSCLTRQHFYTSTCSFQTPSTSAKTTETLQNLQILTLLLLPPFNGRVLAPVTFTLDLGHTTFRRTVPKLLNKRMDDAATIMRGEKKKPASPAVHR